MISLDKITITSLTQARADISETKISEYVEHLETGGTFPPVKVFFDESDGAHYLADGWHRFLAHSQIGSIEIDAEIITGTARDAILYALSANASHGMPRTSADKRRAVGIMLSDAEWSLWSDNSISKACAVSQPFVSSVRKTIADGTEQTERRYTTKSGAEATMKTGGIGAKNVVKQPVENIFTEFKQENDENLLPGMDYVPAEYLDLDAARDTIRSLQDTVTELTDAIACGSIKKFDDQIDAAQIIKNLRAEIVTLSATAAAATSSRDSMMRDMDILKRQCDMQRAELKKLIK